MVSQNINVRNSVSAWFTDRFASKYSLCVFSMYKLLYIVVLCRIWCFWSIWTAYNSSIMVCTVFKHFFTICATYFLYANFWPNTHSHCKQARQILSSFQPCNETNDCLPARQCAGRLRTRQVQLCLKLLCLNLSGQNGDFRKVSSRGKCKWAPWKCCRESTWMCVCVSVCVKSELVCLTWALDENSTKTVAQQSNQLSF